ncbi:MAG: ABC transporter ATP-binding protein [Anaerolineales bacterium]
MVPDLEFRNVSFEYEGSTRPALRDINLTIQPGEIVLITGPAGAGKTTLCCCANGLVPHYHEGRLSGEVIVRGYQTARSRIGGLSSLVGLVFQDPESQLVTASVADEVAFGPENLGVPRAEIETRVAEALRVTRLAGFDGRDPHSLSGGEQQACVIAAVYAMHPEIYVMDEPLANLDPAGRSQVFQVMIDVAKRRGKTLVLVEHALEEVLPWVDRVVVLEDGRIVRDGTVAEVLSAGDMPNVFIRPPIARLGAQFGLNPPPLTPEGFVESLRQQHGFRRHAPVETPMPAPAYGPAVIQMEGLEYSYAGGHAALRGVDLTIHKGEMAAILGRNGAGKTTLVRHLIGLLQPDRGAVTVLGLDVARTPTHQLARQVGFCFQNPNHQLVAFKVREEIAFGLRAHDVDPTEIETRTLQALESVGMSAYREAEIFDLGKGQRQRLALASVLALEPSVLVIDEPTTGQDPTMAQEIFEILKRLNGAGTTILVVTHNLELAAAYCPRAMVMADGRVAFDGSFPELFGQPDRMRELSLAPPQTTQVATLLADYGVPVWASTFEQLSVEIAAILEPARGD